MIFRYFESRMSDISYENAIPSAQGIKYIKNGKKYMEVIFGNDWFIQSGTEYYENGTIKTKL